MRPRVLTISPYSAADNDAVAPVQSVSALEEFLLDGLFEDPVGSNIAVMDEPRQVVCNSTNNLSAAVILITGTDSKGNQLVEAIVGPNNGDSSTVRAFATVTSIVPSIDVVSMRAGTVDIVSTNWLPLDYLVNDFQVSLGIGVGGAAADLTVELTLSNILDFQGNNPIPVRGQTVGSEFDRFFPEINIFDHDSLVNIAADTTGNLAFPVRAIRLKSNAVLTGDDVRLEVIQASHRSS